MPSFYRKGPPVRIPVSFDSGSEPFDMAGKIPMNSSAFMFINPNPFDIRLEGTGNATMGAEQGFNVVSDTSGWLILARTLMGPFTSKMPAFLSVKAVSTRGIPIPEDYDFTGCFLELVYGEGD